jgi:lipopolysaccharide transport system permease protein
VTSAGTAFAGFPSRHSVRQQFDLVRELVSRDLKVKYKRSALGLGWSLLNPLLQLVVFGTVFTYILPLHIPNYSSFLFTGILAWSWFQGALMGATTCIVDNGGLLRQPRFPAAMLPLVTVATHWLYFLLALPILIVGSLATGNPAGRLWTLPFIMAVEFLFTLALAYVLASLHVFFRDTQHILGVLLMLGFYLVPIFYRSDTVPAFARTWYNLNPLVTIVDGYHAAVLPGSAPDWLGLAVIAGGSCALLAVSATLFLRASDKFVEEL